MNLSGGVINSQKMYLSGPLVVVGLCHKRMYHHIVRGGGISLQRVYLSGHLVVVGLAHRECISAHH